jgi:hypothetical protein
MDGGDFTPREERGEIPAENYRLVTKKFINALFIMIFH